MRGGGIPLIQVVSQRSVETYLQSTMIFLDTTNSPSYIARSLKKPYGCRTFLVVVLKVRRIGKLIVNLSGNKDNEESSMKMMVIMVAILIAFTCSAYAETVEVMPPQNKILGSSNGRYVFGQISSKRQDQYMLDTQTGRLWQIVQSKDESISLQIVPYGHIDGSVSVVPEDIQNAVVQILMKQTSDQEKKSGKK